MYYTAQYGDFIFFQNERNIKNRHPERNRTVEDLLKNKKTCPEETIYQIGTIEESVPPEILLQVENEFFGEMEKRFGTHVHILNWALHLDEGTPHIQERHVFDCKNQYGEICPQQEKALKELGIPLPDPSKPKGRHNNRKQTFDAMCREMLFEICERYGLQLEREPIYGGKSYLEKNDFIIEKQKQVMAEKEQALSEITMKLEDDNVFRKMQGHWIVEMSEMIATANAKSIEDIKSFLSRQKETYKVPYDKQPDDRLRQCVFGGTSNTLDFLPLDRTGNRRFLPIMVYPEKAEVHIMEDEKASRDYIEQMWAEAMVIYSSKQYQLALSREMERYLKEFQKQFMPEDTKAGMIQGFLDSYKGNMVCSKMLYKEALNHPFDEPKQWEIREINDIMNNSIVGWKQFTNPRHFAGYGRQKG